MGAVGAKGWGRGGAKGWGRVGCLECDGVRHLSRAVEQQLVASAAVDQPAASQLAEDVSGVPFVARHRRHGRAAPRGRSTVAARRLARLRRLRRLRRCRRRSEVPVAWRAAHRIHKHELSPETEITLISLGLGLQLVLHLALGTTTTALRTAAAAAAAAAATATAAAAAAAAAPSQMLTRRALSSPQPPRHTRHWSHATGRSLWATQQHHAGQLGLPVL